MNREQFPGSAGIPAGGAFAGKDAGAPREGSRGAALKLPALRTLRDGVVLPYRASASWSAGDFSAALAPGRVNPACQSRLDAENGQAQARVMTTDEKAILCRPRRVGRQIPVSSPGKHFPVSGFTLIELLVVI